MVLTGRKQLGVSVLSENIKIGDLRRKVEA